MSLNRQVGGSYEKKLRLLKRCWLNPLLKFMSHTVRHAQRCAAHMVSPLGIFQNVIKEKKMTIETIDCPHCEAEINIREVLASQVEDAVKRKSEDLEAQHRSRSSTLADRESAIKQEEANFQSRVADEVTSKLAEKESQIKQQILKDQELASKAKDSELEALHQQLNSYRKLDAENESLKRELANTEDKVRLEEQQKLSQDRAKIREEAIASTTAQYDSQLAEYQLQLSQTQKALQEAQRKASQRSQQLQGEVAELNIEEALRNEYVDDEVAEVPKGIPGADCELIVNGKTLKPAGSILIESKAAQTFRKEYLEKFKNDLAESDAVLGVLVTRTLPASAGQQLFLQDGPIFIAHTSVAMMCIAILRNQLITTNRRKTVEDFRASKAEQLYSLVTSEDFILRMHYCFHLYSQAAEKRKKSRRDIQRSWATEDKTWGQFEKFITESLGEVQPLMPANVIARIEPEEDEQQHFIESKVRH